MSDRIRLNEMVFYGHHGVLSEERKLGQQYVVDVEIRADLRTAGESDDLAHTVNYADVYRTVEEVLTGPPHQLIEALAEQVASRILERFPRAETVGVSVRKLRPPISGAVLDSSEVEIERHRASKP